MDDADPGRALQGVLGFKDEFLVRRIEDLADGKLKSARQRRKVQIGRYPIGPWLVGRSGFRPGSLSGGSCFAFLVPGIVGRAIERHVAPPCARGSSLSMTLPSILSSTPRECKSPPAKYARRRSAHSSLALLDKNSLNFSQLGGIMCWGSPTPCLPMSSDAARHRFGLGWLCHNAQASY